MRPSDLDGIRPLRADDPDFPVALEAMRAAVASPLTRGHADRFWCVDASGAEPCDMVSVVDLVALGNIARASADWPSQAAEARVFPIHDRHAVQDVLEALVRIVRDRRLEAGQPRP